MKYNLKYIPIIVAAAGVLSSCFANRDRVLAVDHLTLFDVDPNDWELIFVLCAETTYKIRTELNRLGNKAILIHTSDEPGLENYTKFYFPHWLFCVVESNTAQNLKHGYNKNLPYSKVYNALLGRAKDSRTKLLTKLNDKNLLDDGIISYHPGSHYGPKLNLDPTPYYNNVWEYEETSIQQLYGNDLNYTTSLDSTTRLTSGYFSSCVLPWNIYNHTMVSIVGETDNVGAHVFTTEKTWKPLLANHPVLYYATPKHEEFLESLGFEMYIKTYGDPDRVASIVSDIAYGGWGDYTYRNWNSIADHNRRLTDAEQWRARLHSWLHENFVR
jgi:hypothetical protein